MKHRWTIAAALTIWGIGFASLGFGVTLPRCTDSFLWIAVADLEQEPPRVWSVGRTQPKAHLPEGDFDNGLVAISFQDAPTRIDHRWYMRSVTHRLWCNAAYSYDDEDGWLRYDGPVKMFDKSVSAQTALSILDTVSQEAEVDSYERTDNWVPAARVTLWDLREARWSHETTAMIDWVEMAFGFVASLTVALVLVVGWRVALFLAVGFWKNLVVSGGENGGER